MHIKQVSAFQCEDGTLHLTFTDAAKHDFRDRLAKEFTSVASLDQDRASRLADAAIQVYERYGVNITRHVNRVNGEILDLLRQGNKIPAIRRYRELTGVGLREAKDAVEQMGLYEHILVPRVDLHGNESIRYPHDPL